MFTCIGKVSGNDIQELCNRRPISVARLNDSFGAQTGFAAARACRFRTFSMLIRDPVVIVVVDRALLGVTDCGERIEAGSSSSIPAIVGDCGLGERIKASRSSGIFATAGGGGGKHSLGVGGLSMKLENQ